MSARSYLLPCVPRHEQCMKVLIGYSGLFQQFDTTLSRHDHIGYQQIDSRLRTPQNVQSTLRISCLNDSVTGTFEDAHRKLAHRFVVFNQQDRLEPCGKFDLFLRLQNVLWFCLSLFHSRKINLECCALPELAVNKDGSSALLDNSVHR